VFVDVTEDTYQIDVGRSTQSIRDEAILVPNLIGNCPDWDRIREIADRHGLQVVGLCDCLGATLAARRPARSDISLTSFAMSHIITAAATGGMVLLDDPALVDRCLLLRRWGRRSEVKFYGSKKGDRSLFSTIDGIEYDDLFIFDEVGEPNRPRSPPFGVVQMKKLHLNTLAASATSRPPSSSPVTRTSVLPQQRRASKPAGTCSRS
jgi:CDP-6-deoxy-D-xylo-4-hexulose-3-dehydrase